MRTFMCAAVAAVGLSLANPPTASAQVYDPNTGQMYYYYTPYANAGGTTYYYPSRGRTVYYYDYPYNGGVIDNGGPPRVYGPGNSYGSLSPGYTRPSGFYSPYPTDYDSVYSPYRRTWRW